MRASRIGERPQPRQRTLVLDWSFGLGLAMVAVLAWWVHGDEPPGLRGEPDLRPFRGEPLLLVYGAPGCATCPARGHGDLGNAARRGTWGMERIA